MNEATHFASAITTEHQVDNAAQSLVTQVKEWMEERPVDLLILFLSPHFANDTETILEILHRELEPRVLLGCTGEAVIGREREIEQEPAMTLVAAHLPEVELYPFMLDPPDWGQLMLDPVKFRSTIGGPEDSKLILMLADPFSTPMDAVLDLFYALYRGVPVVGGVASGTQRKGGNALLLDDHVAGSGIVGVAIAGPVEIDVIVSQGCRPIGDTYTVTQAEENLIYSLDNESPLALLQTLVGRLSTDEQGLLRNGLFLGRAIVPTVDAPGRGDFLIRSVMGVDQQSGAIAIGDYVEEGEKVQFHVRDAVTAEEDLQMLLLPQTLYEPVKGALLFSCNGRGTRLYDHPDGDISIIQQALGGVDLAGFFCAGEIGPVGGRNFLHGHTASLVLFRSPSTGREAH